LVISTDTILSLLLVSCEIFATLARLLNVFELRDGCRLPVFFGCSLDGVHWHKIITLIVLGICLMQGIYTCMPETNHVPREHRVAAILVLLFMVLISLVSALTPLYLYVSTLRNMCAVPNMAVFCSSVTSWFPGMLLTHFLNYFEMVPVAPVVTGITFVFTFHIPCISIVRSLIINLLSLSWSSLTAIKFSLGGSSLYTSTDKTNEIKYT
jgi:hypothetical protein